MDHERLRTASTYLNNLLLARGLLRNGEPVDFVKPSKDTRAQIINLVHDMILREDRDKEQRENAVHTIRQLRAEDGHKTKEIDRLTAKGEEAMQSMAQAQAAERTARLEMKKVEKAMKTLQDQTAKLKTTLSQVKTQCTNDVRKRDLELARLKTHLQGQQRGKAVGMVAPSMTVRKTVVESSPHDLGDPQYSLKQETTEFLTQLSQSLSDENDSLINVIRNTLATLQDLLGLSANPKRHPDSAIGSIGSEEDVNGKRKSRSTTMHTLPTSFEALSTEMDSALSHIKTLLTNPNFVSVEEVEVREEEISRLREGWEHMEGRWRDVLFMMQGWLKRMNTGDSINIEDLRKGMGLVSPDRSQIDRGRRPEPAEHSFVGSDMSEIKLPGMDDPSGVSLSPPLPSSPGRESPKRKRDALEPPKFFDLRPGTASSRSARALSSKHTPGLELEYHETSNASLPEEHDDEDESEELEGRQMTIAEKLSAAQLEAEAAAASSAATTASGSRAEASHKRARVPTYGLDGSMDNGLLNSGSRLDSDTLGKMPSPMGKRTKIRGRPKKRKSTLSPEELQTLISAAAAADDGE